MTDAAAGTEAAKAAGVNDDDERLKAALKRYAASIGIARLGVTDAAPFLEMRARLEQRRATTGFSPFETDDIDLRVDPQRQLPGVRSLISIAVSYRVPPLFAGSGHAMTRGRRPALRRRPPWRGWISKHAWGQDYHRTVMRKLDLLERWLRRRAPEARFLKHVDTGAPIDRAVAERAGVGWIGKNCALIVPGVGSYVVLGTLLTTLPLPPDPPSPPPGYECVNCDRCLRACPSGALFAPHRLDYRRCLSYVTQMKGIIPEDLRRPLGNRLYGCDTCQDVCPHNRAVPTRGELAFVPESSWDAAPDLCALLDLSKKQFQRIYGHKASGWRGRKTLQRNAVVALGNLADAAAVPRLRALLLHDVRVELRAMAAWALGEIGGDAAREALTTASARETDATVRREITAALAQCA